MRLLLHVIGETCSAHFAGVFRGNAGEIRSIALAFCASRCMLLQCGSGRVPLALPSPSLGVSSLDLGRLHCERPFFFFNTCRPLAYVLGLFCGCPIRSQFFQRDCGKSIGQKFKLAGELRK